MKIVFLMLAVVSGCQGVATIVKQIGHGTIQDGIQLVCWCCAASLFFDLYNEDTIKKG